MDLESVFSGGDAEKPLKGASLTVWQAEVALRLSKSLAYNIDL